MSEVMEAPSKAIDLKGRVSIYQPEQEGLIFPQLPTFKNHALHRQHLKERLVGACRAFALHGFDYGFAGHLTVRDPEHPGLYWTNPMAVPSAICALTSIASMSASRSCRCFRIWG